ncbi:hypothetical protein P153DRAFT_423023 [Dothidotthia symphoricarpi CBS 119687]|uniref:Uncharacterized protein n=1 Tax=Dothidotthia symphoricarpi CBS 119687 TaxID=1392245 RepID=A0A6A6AE95_9PLEO|nr:uncharacterized protein P153DRAFT_423023 [Dothidotthia symphoricarpi CBS 119687]KAF2129425.1 hypothetical protein P153DRAFT_423023 [Dothidotthia symphoricarpi CBS 119687]
MYYLIHTTYHSRPYVSIIPFIARDFRKWGYRVDSYTSDSPYIAEVKLREKIAGPGMGRTEIMEIWAREVVGRRWQGHIAQQSEVEGMVEEGLSLLEKREARASGMVGDFVFGVAEFGISPSVHTPLNAAQHPVPTGPLALINKYMRLLNCTKYIPNATLPPWSTPDITIADQIIIEFRFHEAFRRAHLVQALVKTVNKNRGRMGRVEKDTMTGVTRVLMFVCVGDCLGVEGGQEPESKDPVPKYERVERPPPYVEDVGSLAVERT